MIDIHCHILNGIDDGPTDVNQSVEMARKAAQEGIKTIIATPHHNNGRYENPKDTILLLVEQMNDRLRAEDIPVTILPGQETRIYGELLAGVETNEILTLNDGGRYLFVELPSGHVPRYTERLLYDIQMVGITPIIVHPERNQEIMEQPDILYRFVEKGTLSQITASSLTGVFGKKVKKFTHQLIEANLTHFVSSDAHNITNRAFYMVEAFQLIEKKYGQEFVYLFQENAQLLVDGKNIYKEVPQRVREKKFLGIF